MPHNPPNPNCAVPDTQTCFSTTRQWPWSGVSSLSIPGGANGGRVVFGLSFPCRAWLGTDVYSLCQLLAVEMVPCPARSSWGRNASWWRHRRNDETTSIWRPAESAVYWSISWSNAVRTLKNQWFALALAVTALIVLIWPGLPTNKNSKPGAFSRCCYVWLLLCQNDDSYQYPNRNGWYPLLQPLVLWLPQITDFC